MAKGIADTMAIDHAADIMTIGRLSPLKAYARNGWQMARYLSIEKATIVSTDT